MSEDETKLEGEAMVIGDKDLIERFEKAKKDNELVLEERRICNRADIEGVRKILREHPSICHIRIYPLPVPGIFGKQNEECFYSLSSDEKWSKIGRKRLEEEWLG